MDARRRVLITGATSGLGREMALQLARRGWRVAVTGRREDRLRDVERDAAAAGGECVTLAGSVSDPETVRRHYGAIRGRWGGLDWAILNAGINDRSDARRFSAGTVRKILDTNVLGAAYWMEAVLPDMLAAKSGTIAGVASVAAWRGVPSLGAYCASKAALVTLLEAARVELIGTGVKIVTVCPGFVRSEMTARRDPSELWFMLETEDGARRILDGIERGRRMVHFPWQMSYFVKYVVHNMPDFMFDAWTRRIVDRRRREAASAAER